MVVTVKDSTRVGDLYLSTTGSVHRVESCCVLPTATLVDVSDGSKVDGASGSLALTPYKSISECTEKEIADALRRVSWRSESLLGETEGLKGEVTRLKHEIQMLKAKEVN